MTITILVVIDGGLSRILPRVSSISEKPMAGKVKRYLLISALVVVVPLAAIGFGLAPINLFFAKPAISELINSNLGMDLEIHGPLRIRFGRSPALIASGITLRFPAADDKPLMQIERLVIKPQTAGSSGW